MHDKGPGFYTAIGPEGRWASILAIDGRALWRLHLTRPIDRDTFDEAEAARLIRRFAGRDFDFEIRSALVWTRREVVTERYQVGRIFLVGDAAHQLSPAGGFGLNTGIGDATNLSWKLAATLAGWGGAELLASYEPERRPIGLRNVRAATQRWAENAAQEPPGPAIDAATPDGERVRARVREDLHKLLIASTAVTNTAHVMKTSVSSSAIATRSRRSSSPTERRRPPTTSGSTIPSPAPVRERRISGCATASRSSTSSAAGSCCCALAKTHRPRVVSSVPAPKPESP